MTVEVAVVVSGSLLVAVLGWIIHQVNNNTRRTQRDESRIASIETNIEWIRETIRKIAEKLDVTGV